MEFVTERLDFSDAFPDKESVRCYVHVREKLAGGWWAHLSIKGNVVHKTHGDEPEDALLYLYADMLEGGALTDHDVWHMQFAKLCLSVRKKVQSVMAGDRKPAMDYWWYVSNPPGVYESKGSGDWEFVPKGSDDD